VPVVVAKFNRHNEISAWRWHRSIREPVESRTPGKWGGCGSGSFVNVTGFLPLRRCSQVPRPQGHAEFRSKSKAKGAPSCNVLYGRGIHVWGRRAVGKVRTINVPAKQQRIAWCRYARAGRQAVEGRRAVANQQRPTCATSTVLRGSAVSNRHNQSNRTMVVRIPVRYDENTNGVHEVMEFCQPTAAVKRVWGWRKVGWWWWGIRFIGNIVSTVVPFNGRVVKGSVQAGETVNAYGVWRVGART